MRTDDSSKTNYSRVSQFASNQGCAIRNQPEVGRSCLGGIAAWFVMALALICSSAAMAVTVPFTASGSWIAPAGVTSVTVEAWGGGGGGGAATGNPAKGGGGAGGQYVSKVVTVVPGNTYAIVVGAGGTVGAAVAGGAGGDSTFDAIQVVSKGGAGGGLAAVANGVGGLGTIAGGVGDVVFAGGNGSDGAGATGVGGAGGGGAGSGGAGGNAVGNTAGAGTAIGGGNGGAGLLARAAGNPGIVAGGGGGGGYATNPTDRSGGGGAAGQVVISYVTAPVVTTSAATSLATTGATLNGLVDDSGASTAATFDYGLTIAYGSTITATQSPLAAGSGSTAVSAAVAGLVCGTTYHFRATGVNSAGTTNGGDLTFTTSPCPTVSVTANPTACTNVAGIGTVAWGTLTGPLTSDNAYATASLDGTTSNYLQCTGYGFAIPVGATINGITVNVERKSDRTTNGGSKDAAMRIVKTGVIGATDRSTATTYTTADVVEAHGGIADLWGEIWTVADINAANFGAAFAAIKANAAGAAHIVSVDHMPITVTYIPPPGPDHILITHAGSALTCSPQTVTITACANAACTAPHYSGGVNVTLTPGGLTFAIDATGINSAATVQQSTVGAATLDAVSVPAAASAATCWNTATATASCAVTFNDSGFLITVPNHVSCNNATATIEAVQIAPGLGCVPAYQSVTRAVNLYSSYSNPAIGTQVVTASTGVVSTAAPGTAHSLVFDATGKATITLSYPDAGQLTLTAGDTAPTGAAMTGSGSFVVAPASFVFSAIPAAPLTAGQAFNATVTAMNACGIPAATPNFNDTVTITSSNPLPGPGNATAINTTLSGFVNGVASINLTWDEVGIIDLNANLANYLGSALSVSGAQTNVGRFQPAYFDTTVTQGCSTFTYAGSTAPVKAGQPFTVTVTANKAGGGVTANYAGAANAYLTTLSNAGVTAGFAGNTIAAASFANGVGSANVTYEVATPQTAPLTLTLRAADADTPAVSSSGHTEGTTEMRSGRAKISNAHGSERLALPVAFRTEYWNSGWVLNSADSCSGDGILGGTVSVALSALPVTCVQDSGNPGLSGAGCAAAGPVGQQFKEGGVAGFAGNFNLWLKAPGTGNTGAVTVTGSVPGWLQYAWGGGATISPAALATFGVYKGSNEFIYLRENY